MVGNRQTRTILLAASLSLPLASHAAGLGKLTVFSGLGQPLRAEIEVVSLQRGEAESLNARLAPVEAFQQANIEYSAALQSIRFNVDRRANNRYVINLTSTQPVNDPFLDVLVELSWSTGRLVREYTFLLDPQDYKGPAVAAAPAAPAAAAPSAEPPRAAAPAPSRPAPAEPPQAPAPSAAAPADASAAGPGGTYTVKRGDTLAKIAAANKPEGVTLQQMIVALYRANESAFDAKNMNRLRTGRIITIPDSVASQAIPNQEANRVIIAQAAEWNAYRQQLAASVANTPTRPGAGPQGAGGQIGQPRVEDSTSRPAGDRLQIAQADARKGGRGGAGAARGDDAAASERALREAQSRVSELETINKKLTEALELKNKQLADLQSQAQAAAKTPPKPVPPKPEVAPPLEPVKPPPIEAAKPPAIQPPVSVEPPKPIEPPKPEAIQPPVPPKPEAVKPPVVAPKPPPAPEPGLWDSILGIISDNIIALGGVILAIVALIGGLIMMRRRRATQIEDSLIGATSQGEASSVFGSTGGRSVDTGGALQTDFSQTGIGAIDTDEVDPVAEADVYMAYGRDAQAEEILKEALQKDPNRHGVRVKLLEIYAQRKDLKAFETTAGELYAATGGAGADWDRAAALGAEVDPTNPMYGGKRGAGGAVAAAGAAVGAAHAEAAMSHTGEMAAPKAGGSVDFNVDTVIHSSKAPEGAGSRAPDLGFDLNLGSSSEVGAGQNSFAPIGAPSTLGEPSTASGLDVDFELSHGAPSVAQPAKPAASAPLDLGSINLDLGAPSIAGAPVDSRWQEVATKLDLAKAYHEMGDREGARELLGEVLKEGDTAQQQAAKKLIETIG